MERIIDSFENVRVAVIGDVMLDRYIWGSADRLAAERPVPVVGLEHETYALGGAGNVASNIVALGGKVLLTSVIGADEHGATIVTLSPWVSKLYYEHGRKTTVKNRLMAGKHMVARWDEEDIEPIAFNHSCLLFKAMVDFSPQVIILSDYDKGVMRPDLVVSIYKWAEEHNIPVLVDPRPANVKLHGRASVLVPNHKELAAMEDWKKKVDIDVARTLGLSLLQKVRVPNLVVKMGQDGMLVFKRKPGVLTEADIEHIPAVNRDVYDVTGAGDTVIATLALALGAEADIFTASKIANLAAGISVTKVGTAAVTQDELLEGAICPCQ